MQEFENYPKLTEYIQEMANTGRVPREWSDFLYQLNQALHRPLFIKSVCDCNKWHDRMEESNNNCSTCDKPIK